MQLYEWSLTLIVLISCKEEPHQINGYGEFFSNLKRDAFVRTIRGDNKTTPKPPERTLGVLKYCPRRTERNLRYIKTVKYLCALGTTFEMIMKQFSSTILENNQIHMLAGLLVLYAEENEM